MKTRAAAQAEHPGNIQGHPAERPEEHLRSIYGSIPASENSCQQMNGQTAGDRLGKQMGTQLNQRLSDRLGKGTRVQTDKPLGRRMSAPIGKPLVQRLGGAISEWPVYLSMAGQILPLAKAELSRWEQRARQIPNPELRRQAVASICKKSSTA